MARDPPPATRERSSTRCRAPCSRSTGRCAIVFVNPAAEQLFGVSRAVLEARPLAELLPFDSPLFDLIRRVGEAGSGVSDYGIELLLGRGESHLVDVHVSPLDEQRGDHLVVLHPCSVAQPARTSSSSHRARRALGRRAGAPPWRTRSRTRSRASAARRSCWSAASARTSGR